MKNLIFGVHPIKYPRRTLKSGRPSTTEPADLAEVALYNEYGTKTSPPRPAFRMGLEEGVEKNRKLLQAQLKNIARRVLQGRTSEVDRSLTVLLTQIGRSAKAATKEIIKSGSTEPNAPATVAKKGFDWPLHETGLLEEHVDYEVK